MAPSTGATMDRRRALALLAASLVTACGRHAFQGKIRLDGLYRTRLDPGKPPPGPPPTYGYLRFFGDGTVFRIIMSAEADFAAKHLVRGFVDTSNRGRWSISGDVVSVSMNDDSVQQIPAAEGQGTISPAMADLTWAGSATGPLHYVFVPVAVEGT